MDAGLSKRERLCSVVLIGSLVEKGSHIASGPLRCCWMALDDDEPLNRIVVSVPKRHFKRAVKRNLLKRRIRESYRLQKSLLPPSGIGIMFIYSAKEVAEFQDIFTAVGDLLGRISTRYSAHAEPQNPHR